MTDHFAVGPRREIGLLTDRPRNVGVPCLDFVAEGADGPFGQFALVKVGAPRFRTRPRAAGASKRTGGET